MTVRCGPFPREPHLHPHLGWALSFGGWALRSNSHISPWAITYPVSLSVLVSKMGTSTPVPQDCPENQSYVWEAPSPWLPPSGLKLVGEGWRIQTRPRGNHGPAPLLHQIVGVLRTWGLWGGGRRQSSRTGRGKAVRDRAQWSGLQRRETPSDGGGGRKDLWRRWGPQLG